jgi:hypothetical protein
MDLQEVPLPTSWLCSVLLLWECLHVEQKEVPNPVVIVHPMKLVLDDSPSSPVQIRLKIMLGVHSCDLKND